MLATDTEEQCGRHTERAQWKRFIKTNDPCNKGKQRKTNEKADLSYMDHRQEQDNETRRMLKEDVEGIYRQNTVEGAPQDRRPVQERKTKKDK